MNCVVCQMADANEVVHIKQKIGPLLNVFDGYRPNVVYNDFSSNGSTIERHIHALIPNYNGVSGISPFSGPIKPLIELSCPTEGFFPESSADFQVVEPRDVVIDLHQPKI